MDWDVLGRTRLDSDGSGRMDSNGLGWTRMDSDGLGRILQMSAADAEGAYESDATPPGAAEGALAWSNDSTTGQMIRPLVK
jgi:hypothetical protein